MNPPHINYPKIIGFLAISFYFFTCIHAPATANNNWHFINSVDLIIHEAGHTLVPSFLFGQFLSALAGSFFQILVPGVFAWYFYRRREIISSSVMMMWLAESLAYVSVYAGDSVKMALPLLGGDGVIHDWNYLLSSAGLLTYTDSISKSMYFCSLAIFTIIFLISLKYIVEKKGSFSP